MGRAKKIFISFLLCIFVFSSLVSPIAVGAQDVGPWYNQSFDQFMGRVYDDSNPTEIFGERYTAAQVQWVIFGFIGFLVNNALGQTITTCILGQDGDFPDPSTCLVQRLGLGQQQGDAVYEKRDMFAYLVQERELSLIGYIKDVGRKMNFVKDVHAQQTGFGFEGLGIIRTLWSATRNLSYALFVLVIIVTAFMIMFRVKLSPQTVVTIQSSLPRIVVALILVTFSYALAGLLVDLMYVVIGVISIFFSSIPESGSPADYFGLMVNGPLNLGALGFAILYAVYFLAYFLITFVFSDVGFVTAAIAVLFPGLGTTIAGALFFFFLIVFVILLIAVIWISIKVLLLLIRTFVNILFLVILAPVQFTLGVIYPGIGAGAWIKSFVSNLAVFPVVGLMYLLAFLFFSFALAASVSGGISGAIALLLNSQFSIPMYEQSLDTGGWPPLLGVSGDIMAFAFLIASLIVVGMIPRAADLIKSMITGRPGPESTIGGTLAGMAALGGAAGLGLLAPGLAAREAAARRANASPYRQAGYIERSLVRSILERIVRGRL